MNVYEPVHPKLGRPFQVGDRARFRLGERMPERCCGAIVPQDKYERWNGVEVTIFRVSQKGDGIMAKCEHCGALASPSDLGLPYLLKSESTIVRFCAAAIELEPVLESEE